MSEWIAYTNQKLYLARQLAELGSRARETSERAACRQGMILLLQQGYVGLLNELAETRRLTSRIEDLDQLSALSGFDSEWVGRLRELAATPGSWLYELLRTTRILAQPGLSGSPVSSVTDASVIAVKGSGVIASSSDEPDWNGVLDQMKTFVAELRELNYQW